MFRAQQLSCSVQSPKSFRGAYSVSNKAALAAASPKNNRLDFAAAQQTPPRSGGKDFSVGEDQYAAFTAMSLVVVCDSLKHTMELSKKLLGGKEVANMTSGQIGFAMASVAHTPLYQQHMGHLFGTTTTTNSSSSKKRTSNKAAACPPQPPSAPSSAASPIEPAATTVTTIIASTSSTSSSNDDCEPCVPISSSSMAAQDSATSSTTLLQPDSCSDMLSAITACFAQQTVQACSNNSSSVSTAGSSSAAATATSLGGESSVQQLDTAAAFISESFAMDLMRVQDVDAVAVVHLPRNHKTAARPFKAGSASIGTGKSDSSSTTSSRDQRAALKHSAGNICQQSDVAPAMEAASKGSSGVLVDAAAVELQQQSAGLTAPLRRHMLISCWGVGVVLRSAAASARALSVRCTQCVASGVRSCVDAATAAAGGYDGLLSVSVCWEGPGGVEVAVSLSA